MKRSKLEILKEFLDATRQEHRVTHLMYSINVCNAVLNRVKESAVKAKLVTEEKKAKRNDYYITKKGEQFLALYEQLEKLLMEAEINGGKSKLTSPATAGGVLTTSPQSPAQTPKPERRLG